MSELLLQGELLSRWARQVSTCAACSGCHVVDCAHVVATVGQPVRLPSRSENNATPLPSTPLSLLPGTAMHHAAMANKKEMMFALARLGCDWRARADGIDGATASFVLCGQHGKTTRQQVRGQLGRLGGMAVCTDGVRCNAVRPAPATRPHAAATTHVLSPKHCITTATHACCPCVLAHRSCWTPS